MLKLFAEEMMKVHLIEFLQILINNFNTNFNKKLDFTISRGQKKLAYVYGMLFTGTENTPIIGMSCFQLTSVPKMTWNSSK